MHDEGKTGGRVQKGIETALFGATGRGGGMGALGRGRDSAEMYNAGVSFSTPPETFNSSALLSTIPRRSFRFNNFLTLLLQENDPVFCTMCDGCSLFDKTKQLRVPKIRSIKVRLSH
jgi:hypothetical protein